MNKIAAFLFGALLITPYQAAAEMKSVVYEHAPDGKMIMGEKEWVRVDALDVVAISRVDTGATTSSISAIDIQPFERDGEEWVSFRLAHHDGQSEVLERPIVRTVRIIQSSSEGFERRYVVDLFITIGDVKTQTEFTLRDRKHLNFPVLLGRTYLKNTALVDVSRKYVQPKPETTVNQ